MSNAYAGWNKIKIENKRGNHILHNLAHNLVRIIRMSLDDHILMCDGLAE